MLFEWCVQAFPSGHVGPPATAGKKRRFGKGLHKRRWWHGRSSSQEVEAYLALGGLCITLAARRWRGCTTRGVACVGMQPPHQLLVLRHTR